jgi:hypothetical protein
VASQPKLAISTKYVQHPLYESVASNSDQSVRQLIKLGGYVGQSQIPETVRLYPALEDLSNYLEFPETAVIYAQDAQPDELANGGMFFWVSSNAEITKVQRSNADSIVQAAPSVIRPLNVHKGEGDGLGETIRPAPPPIPGHTGEPVHE